MRVLRLIKGVTRRDRLRNEDIGAELQVKSILQFIEEAQLRWYGHVRRMSTSRTALRWLEWKPNTARPRGNDGWTMSKRLSKSEDLRWRRSNNQHCSWTEANGKTSSLTGHRPTSTAVQGTIGNWYEKPAPKTGARKMESIYGSGFWKFWSVCLGYFCTCMSTCCGGGQTHGAGR